MASADNEQPVRGHSSEQLQQFLLFLGSGLTAAGEAVNEIEAHLLAVARIYGAPEARVAVLPTLILVSLEPTHPATVEPTRQLRGVLRLDQTSALFAVLKRARRGEVAPADGVRQILDAVSLAPRFGPTVTIAGHATLTVGICMVLQPSWDALTLAALFGALVGALKHLGGRWVSTQMIMPVVAAFLVSAITFWLAARGWASADLRAMIAPLATFLPGARLTMAVIELSAAELVAGASRLVAGTLQLVLLGFGMVLGVQTVDPSSPVPLTTEPQNLLGWWAPWAGVFVFAVGVFVYNSAPRRSFGWLLVVMATAFAGQQVGGHVLGGYVAGFFGGLAVSITARAVERLPDGPPALVSFLPAFWLLVPGSLGLIGMAEYMTAGSPAALSDLVGTVEAMVAIALGVLCGHPLVGSVAFTYRRIARRWSG